jgi:HAE1 family hydrophobic/amphiphilic exporter-1
MLMGLVTKNAILLVDYSKHLRAEGMERREAVITAGRTRLRPIMMTTLAMIFGMLPLALGLGAGAEMRAPMGRAVIGGLITSTMLTLLVVPVMYTLLDDLGVWLKKKWDSGMPVNGNGHTVVLALVAMGLILLKSLPAMAAEPQVVSLEQALKMAADRNKDIKMAMEYSHLVQGRYVEERSAAFPKLTLTGTAVTVWDESQAIYNPLASVSQSYYEGKVTLTQPLFTWGQIGAAIKLAKIGLKTADDEMTMYRQAVARDVSTAFYDVLLSKELHDIAVQMLDQKTRHLDEAKRKYAAGTATDYDVLSADVAVSNARPEVIKTQSMMTLSMENLGILIGLSGKDFTVTGEMAPVIVPVPDNGEIADKAMVNRPELSELQHKVGMQSELVKVYNAQDKPRIDFQANYAWRDLQVGGDKRGNGEISSAAVVLSFPFFDGLKTRGKVAQTRSDYNTLVLQTEKMKDSIRLQVTEAVSKLKESGETLQALRNVVGQAERLLDMAEKGFTYGVKTSLDVQDAQLALKEARGNLARARRDYLVAHVTVQWVAGTLPLTGDIK